MLFLLIYRVRGLLSVVALDARTLLMDAEMNLENKPCSNERDLERASPTTVLSGAVSGQKAKIQQELPRDQPLNINHTHPGETSVWLWRTLRPGEGSEVGIGGKWAALLPPLTSGTMGPFLTPHKPVSGKWDGGGGGLAGVSARGSFFIEMVCTIPPPPTHTH